VLSVVLPALRVSLVTGVLCGIAYPLAVTGLGQWLLPSQANGSLERASYGTVLGSRLIGQQWSGPEWFHGRPSATVETDSNDPPNTVSLPYNAASSGGSNLGPISITLVQRLGAERKAIQAAQPELAGRTLPADMLTASASGLDPDISPANAALQVPRIAAARGIAIERLAALVARHTAGRALGIFGEPRVNVLQLNLDLRNTYPVATTPER
jgi:potassium-transporting ATPase KdpC subunit